jgi:hypothetical protein
MTGVRLGDGTAWVKSRGYTWTLGSYMAAKLYPQGAPAACVVVVCVCGGGGLCACACMCVCVSGLVQERTQVP